MDAALAQDLSRQWVLLKTSVLFSGTLADQGQSAKAVLSVGRNGKDLQWTAIDIQNCYPAQQWNEATFELRLPDSLQAGDYLKAYVWSQSPDTIWVKKVGIYRLYYTGD